MALFDTLKTVLTPYAEKINKHTTDISILSEDAKNVRADLNEAVDSLNGSLGDLENTITQQNNAQSGLNSRDIANQHAFEAKDKGHDERLGKLEAREQRVERALTAVWYSILNTDGNELLLSDNNWIAHVQYECRDYRYDGLSGATTDNANAISDLSNQVASLHQNDFNMFGLGLPVLKMFGDFNTMSKSDKKSIEYYYYETGSQLINNRQLVLKRILVANGTGNCKWQGQSSVNLPKKNFTVTLQDAIPREGWFIGKKAVLKGNYNDATFSRNVVSAKIWGDVVHSRSNIETSPILDSDNNELWIEADVPILIYSVPFFGCVNGGAIDGFPILVEINGEYAGIYDFTIKKGEEELMLCGGNQYEAVIGAEVDSLPVRFKGTALCDGTDFEVEYASDDFTDTLIAESINAAISACINANTEQDYRDNVCTKIDIDSAIDYWIFSMMIQNWDGITKNYLLVTYDGTKWYFSAYDLDHTFGNCIANREIPRVDKANTQFSYLADINRLFYLIKQYDSDKILARYNVLVAGALSESNIMLSFSKFVGAFPKRAIDKESEIWPFEYWSNMQNYSQIVNFYRLRKEYIGSQITQL